MSRLDEKALLDKGDPKKLFDEWFKIASGSYGTVWKAREKKTGLTCAVKVVDFEEDENFDNFLLEVAVLRKLAGHKNIVGLLGAWKRTKKRPFQLIIAMEYCGGGTASELALRVNKGVPEQYICYIAKETLVGLSFMHERGIMHRDIKGGNVLINDKGHVKLVDFGIAGILENERGKRKTLIGSPYWLAPEVISVQVLLKPYSNRVDIWSVAILCLEMAQVRPPHWDLEPLQAMSVIPRVDPPTLQEPHLWSNAFENFLSACLQMEEELRPSAREALNHPWFRYACDSAALSRYVHKTKLGQWEPIVPPKMENSADKPMLQSNPSIVQFAALQQAIHSCATSQSPSPTTASPIAQTQVLNSTTTAANNQNVVPLYAAPAQTLGSPIIVQSIPVPGTTPVVAIASPNPVVNNKPPMAPLGLWTPSSVSSTSASAPSANSNNNGSSNNNNVVIKTSTPSPPKQPPPPQSLPNPPPPVPKPLPQPVSSPIVVPVPAPVSVIVQTPLPAVPVVDGPLPLPSPSELPPPPQHMSRRETRVLFEELVAFQKRESDKSMPLYQSNDKLLPIPPPRGSQIFQQPMTVHTLANAYAPPPAPPLSMLTSSNPLSVVPPLNMTSPAYPFSPQTSSPPQPLSPASPDTNYKKPSLLDREVATTVLPNPKIAALGLAGSGPSSANSSWTHAQVKAPNRPAPGGLGSSKRSPRGSPPLSPRNNIPVPNSSSKEAVAALGAIVSPPRSPRNHRPDGVARPVTTAPHALYRTPSGDVTPSSSSPPSRSPRSAAMFSGLVISPPSSASSSAMSVQVSRAKAGVLETSPPLSPRQIPPKSPVPPLAAVNLKPVAIISPPLSPRTQQHQGAFIARPAARSPSPPPMAPMISTSSNLLSAFNAHIADVSAAAASKGPVAAITTTLRSPPSSPPLPSQGPPPPPFSSSPQAAIPPPARGNNSPNPRSVSPPPQQMLARQQPAAAAERVRSPPSKQRDIVAAFVQNTPSPPIIPPVRPITSTSPPRRASPPPGIASTTIPQPAAAVAPMPVRGAVAPLTAQLKHPKPYVLSSTTAFGPSSPLSASPAPPLSTSGSSGSSSSTASPKGGTPANTPTRPQTAVMTVPSKSQPQNSAVVRLAAEMADVPPKLSPEHPRLPPAGILSPLPEVTKTSSGRMGMRARVGTKPIIDEEQGAVLMPRPSHG